MVEFTPKENSTNLMVNSAIFRYANGFEPAELKHPIFNELVCDDAYFTDKAKTLPGKDTNISVIMLVINSLSGKCYLPYDANAHGPGMFTYGAVTDNHVRNHTEGHLTVMRYLSDMANNLTKRTQHQFDLEGLVDLIGPSTMSFGYIHMAYPSIIAVCDIAGVALFGTPGFDFVEVDMAEYVQMTNEALEKRRPTRDITGYKIDGRDHMVLDKYFRWWLSYHSK